MFSAIQRIFPRNAQLARATIQMLQAGNQTANNSARLISPALIQSAYFSDKPSQIHDRIKGMIGEKPIVVFMKGNPEQPRCGFSKAVCDILRMHGANFESYDVLEDQELRAGIKEYSEWPTIPQVYFKGEFIGGCDIMLDMHRSGDLIEELKRLGIKSKIEDEIENETK